MKGICFSVAVFIALALSEGQHPSIELQQKEVVCFVYHRFGDGRYPSTNITVADFEAHIKYLVDNGFQLLTFSDAIVYLKSDKPSRKTAVITIDDGYRSFYKNGLPVLKKFNVPATLFINTQTVGGDYMNWDELRDVVRQNIEIGNHTHSHNYFLDLPPSKRYDTFRDELELSQSIIKKNLQLEPRAFSFPYGECDAEMKRIVKDAGFLSGAAQNSGVISRESDLFLCPRFPMSEAYATKVKFIEKAEMHALPVVNRFPDDFILGKDNPPLLTLKIDVRDLSLKQIQCFVQGAECEVKVSETTDMQAIVTMRSKAPLVRRRTLYTVTIPDKKGRWHWFSHLWINPAVPERGTE